MLFSDKKRWRCIQSGQNGTGKHTNVYSIIFYKYLLKKTVFKNELKKYNEYIAFFMVISRIFKVINWDKLNKTQINAKTHLI